MTMYTNHWHQVHNSILMCQSFLCLLPFSPSPASPITHLGGPPWPAGAGAAAGRCSWAWSCGLSSPEPSAEPHCLLSISYDESVYLCLKETAATISQNVKFRLITTRIPTDGAIFATGVLSHDDVWVYFWLFFQNLWKFLLIRTSCWRLVNKFG